MVNMNAFVWVAIAIAVVIIVVAVGLGVWWVRASRARREHEAQLRGLGVGFDSDRGVRAAGGAAAPFEPGLTQSEPNDTVRVTPLSGIDFDYERLAAEPFQAPPGVPLGQPVSAEPFSWTAAISEHEPFELPEVEPLPATAAPPAVRSVPRVTPEPAGAASITEASDFTEDLDRTTVVRRESRVAGHLVLPDGEELPLHRDNVVGRRPESVPGVHAVVIPDPTRTLSKTHARLSHDGEGWVVEDLDSTNGVVLLHDDGREQELDPRQPVIATPRILLGTLEIEIRDAAERD
ncbi:FHA domain-containing protein [Leucobacter sp. W1153]|uniref:FHA domain-containing protein n=1 Tax=unclassified Leucobacter TaxID=2621730 RepID=UPI003F310D6E